MTNAALRSVLPVGVVLAVLAVVLGGCFSSSSATSTPTTTPNKPRSAVVVVQLKTGTSPNQADVLTDHLVELGGEITGTNWSHSSPDVVHVYLRPSETVAEVDRLLPRIKKMSHVKGATLQLG